MKFMIVCFSFIMSLLLVSAQNFGGFSRFNSLTGDFGGPTAFSGSSFPSAAINNGVRDPRENRGPVVFPASPPDAIEETSGVIVGASGFGFVPPRSSQNAF